MQVICGVFPESISFWEFPTTGFCNRNLRSVPSRSIPGKEITVTFWDVKDFTSEQLYNSFFAQLPVSEGSYISFWVCEFGGDNEEERGFFKSPAEYLVWAVPRKEKGQVGIKVTKKVFTLLKQGAAQGSQGMWGRLAGKWMQLFSDWVLWSWLAPTYPWIPGNISVLSWA